jgi:hypothetical protein
LLHPGYQFGIDVSLSSQHAIDRVDLGVLVHRPDQGSIQEVNHRVGKKKSEDAANCDTDQAFDKNFAQFFQMLTE